MASRSSAAFYLCRTAMCLAALTGGTALAPAPGLAQQAPAARTQQTRAALDQRVEQAFLTAHRKTTDTWGHLDLLILPPTEDNFKFAKAVAHDPAALRAATQHFLATMEARMAGQSGEANQALLFYWREIARGLMQLADEIEAPANLVSTPAADTVQGPAPGPAETRALVALRETLAASVFDVFRAVEAFESGALEKVPKTYPVNTAEATGRLDFDCISVFEPDSGLEGHWHPIGTARIAIKTRVDPSMQDFTGLTDWKYLLDEATRGSIDPADTPLSYLTFGQEPESTQPSGVIYPTYGEHALGLGFPDPGSQVRADLTYQQPMVEFVGTFHLFTPVDPSAGNGEICVPNYQITSDSVLSIPSGSFSDLWQCFEATPTN